LIICHILELLIHTRDSFLCLWSCYCLFIEWDVGWCLVSFR
jgi:hypothetical protein